MLAGTMARKKNPINDIVDTVGGWLGGRGPGTNPQVQAAMQATRAIARTADTATGGFGQALLSDAQRMAMTGSSTPSALYKTAAVNLGAAAAGVGAAKVAGKVVQSGRVVNPVAAAKNKLTGREVWIHASSEQGLGRILPRTSTDLTRLQPDKALTFGVRTGGKGSADYIKEYSEQLTSGFSSKGTTGLANTPKSAYVTTTPSKTVTPYQYGGMWGRTTQSQQVVKEISLSGKTADQIARELTRGTRQAGGRLRKDVSAARKVSQKTKRAISKRRRSTDVIAPID
jgi:hypothetical protein